MLGAAALLLAACGSGSPSGGAATSSTSVGPPTPVPSLGVQFGALLGAVPHAFLQFSNLVEKDQDPSGGLLYQQAAPVMSALQALDGAFARASAPRRIADDMATLVVADERLLSELHLLPGLSGNGLAAWERQFSTDGKAEQSAFGNVLYDFALPSVGTQP